MLILFEHMLNVIATKLGVDLVDKASDLVSAGLNMYLKDVI